LKLAIFGFVSSYYMTHQIDDNATSIFTAQKIKYFLGGFKYFFRNGIHVRLLNALFPIPKVSALER
jgi:hypothetical protein